MSRCFMPGCQLSSTLDGFNGFTMAGSSYACSHDVSFGTSLHSIKVDIVCILVSLRESKASTVLMYTHVGWSRIRICKSDLRADYDSSCSFATSIITKFFASLNTFLSALLRQHQLMLAARLFDNDAVMAILNMPNLLLLGMHVLPLLYDIHIEEMMTDACKSEPSLKQFEKKTNIELDILDILVDHPCRKINHQAESAETPRAYITASSLADSSKSRSEKMHGAMTISRIPNDLMEALEHLTYRGLDGVKKTIKMESLDLGLKWRVRMFKDEDEGKDEIKGLIWVNNQIAIQGTKEYAYVIMGLFSKKMFGVYVEEMKSLVG
ncbi:hypothetical protein Tco_1043005 [Tanacetum coccineum]|uniref:Uncharacterized protein n=1 Tax=Tanacetum coccineum TaxID=301880 RepID=A0ABQ5GKU3_9ASTR